MKATLHRLNILLVLVTAFSGHASERDEFRQGIEAFRAGYYGEALQHFEQAERLGLDTVTLHYNLGATHFRLGNLDASARHFQRIRRDRAWAALAEYNLGLIAERQQEPERARRHYREALRRAESDRIHGLAQARLRALDPAPVAAIDPGWVFYLSAAAVYDDNPALAKGDDFAPGKDSDFILETLGSMSGYLRGHRDDGIRLNAGFYSRNHDDFSEFDITGVSASLSMDRQGDIWRFERGVRVANYWLDGSRYTTEGALVLHAQRGLGATHVSIRNDLAYIDADSDFAFIEGVRNRLTLELFGRADIGRWRVGYRNEFNDRDDLDADDTFLSYSPWRHEFYGDLRRRLTDRLDAQARLEYRHSRYRDDNREFDTEGDLIEGQRRENRWVAALLLRYNLNRTFSTFVEYRFTDNDSNFDRFTYRGNQVQLGIDAAF